MPFLQLSEIAESRPTWDDPGDLLCRDDIGPMLGWYEVSHVVSSTVKAPNEHHVQVDC